MPKAAHVTIQGTSPYSSSKVIDPQEFPKLPKEKPDDYELRSWQQRLHVDAQGTAFIPQMSFKMALDSAAKRFSPKIVGKGNATYTKFFEAGVMVFEPLLLPGVTRENVTAQRLFVPSDGVKGGGKRVWKIFPIVHKWGGIVTFNILDDTITKDIFETILQQAVSFIGIGRWRPERGGGNGRSKIIKIEWSEE
jgi:hypothetical protein